MPQKILVTSALPYANGPLHFGHIAGAYLPGDCYARFQRLRGKEVLYICGSDEYGMAITLSAELAERTPREHVDIFHAINQDLFKKLNFSFDHFSRTTWSGHQAPTHQFFQDLLANGYIEERVTPQLYSPEDQRFLADRYVMGNCPKCDFAEARGDECQQCGASYEATDLKNPRSKITKAPLEKKETKHWFLVLEKFKEQLLSWLEKKNWKPNVMNFIKGYINELHARAITRDLDWGIPVPLPNSEGKVLYVWFDAPIGYISASQEWAQLQGTPERWKDYWLINPDHDVKLVNFIGKDNIPFHAAIFPAMILGQNQPYKLVDELPANEFYKLEGRQFSKSDGWYINLDDFFERYTADQIRYTIAANAPETADSEFTWKDFQMRCNTELLGKYGNLVNRVLVFAKNNCESKVPSQDTLTAGDRQFLSSVQELVQEAADCYEQFKLRRAVQVIMELAQLGNSYFDNQRPWKIAKQPETRQAMQTTIACCLECLKCLALISAPIMPTTADKVWKMLGFTTDLQAHEAACLQDKWQLIAKTPLTQDQTMEEPKILFTKIEDSQIAEEVSKLQGMANKETTSPSVIQAEVTPSYKPLQPLIDFEEIKKLDLRVGVVLQAEAVPKSKKLLKLTIDLGFEQRTVVSGISQQYKPEQLLGKKVVLVANLKPATLMGIESQGMILAASWQNEVKVLEVPDLPAGSSIS